MDRRGFYKYAGCTQQEFIRNQKVLLLIPIGNYGGYYDNIYRAMSCGAELLIKPEEVVDVLRIVEAAQDSREQKRQISLK